MANYWYNSLDKQHTRIQYCNNHSAMENVTVLQMRLMDSLCVQDLLETKREGLDIKISLFRIYEGKRSKFINMALKRLDFF